MSVTVELISFAVQAAVNLARTGRQIYKEETIKREIVIPFPSGFSSDIGAAREYAAALKGKS